MKAASAPGELASAPVDLSKAVLERLCLQATKRQVSPALLCSPAWPRIDDSDKL